MIRSFLITLFLFLYVEGFSQNKKVTNIFFRTIGNKVEIFYDLPRNTDTLDVSVYFRKKSNPKMKYRLKWVTGSIGIGTFSGKKLKIVWNFKKEPHYLFTGRGFYYEIEAKKWSLTNY